MRAVALITALALAACGDNTGRSSREDAGLPADAAADATAPGVGGPCLDRPTDMPRAPGGALPCELLPPGFVAP